MKIKISEPELGIQKDFTYKVSIMKKKIMWNEAWNKIKSVIKVIFKMILYYS